MRILSIFAIICLLFCLGIYEANAQHREHKAHSHGVATLEISIEKGEIEADLEVPGIDLVGFEGKAKTDKHKQQLKTVTDLLTKEYQLFNLPEAAGCKVTQRKFKADHDDKHPDHSDYEYEIEYKCTDISKVKELDVNLFRDVESLKNITVQLVTEKGQKEVKLTPTSSKITLE